MSASTEMSFCRICLGAIFSKTDLKKEISPLAFSAGGELFFISFSALDCNGENKVIEVMAEYSGVNLPIGKYYMSTFRYALKKYVALCDEHSQLS